MASFLMPRSQFKLILLSLFFELENDLKTFSKRFATALYILYYISIEFYFAASKIRAMQIRAIRGMTHAQKNIERKSKMLVHTLDGRRLERFFFA